jgi:hypothetical protein
MTPFRALGRHRTLLYGHSMTRGAGLTSGSVALAQQLRPQCVQKSTLARSPHLAGSILQGRPDQALML